MLLGVLTQSITLGLRVDLVDKLEGGVEGERSSYQRDAQTQDEGARVEDSRRGKIRITSVVLLVNEGGHEEEVDASAGAEEE